jgi:hypothetical protein
MQCCVCIQQFSVLTTLNKLRWAVTLAGCNDGRTYSGPGFRSSRGLYIFCLPARLAVLGLTFDVEKTEFGCRICTFYFPRTCVPVRL